jgi:hypothetical protein
VPVQSMSKAFATTEFTHTHRPAVSHETLLVQG